MHTASAQQTKNPLRPLKLSLLTSLPLLEVRADAPTFFVFWSIVPQDFGSVNNFLHLFLVIFTHIPPFSGHHNSTRKRATTKGGVLMDNYSKNQNSNKNSNKTSNESNSR